MVDARWRPSSCSLPKRRGHRLCGRATARRGVHRSRGARLVHHGLRVARNTARGCRGAAGPAVRVDRHLPSRFEHIDWVDDGQLQTASNAAGQDLAGEGSQFWLLRLSVGRTRPPGAHF